MENTSPHDKIGKVASAFITDVSKADMLITDDAADATVLGNLRSEGLVIDLVRSGLEPENEGKKPRSIAGI